jgi:hypothetical protein
MNPFGTFTSKKELRATIEKQKEFIVELSRQNAQLSKQAKAATEKAARLRASTPKKVMKTTAKRPAVKKAVKR